MVSQDSDVRFSRMFGSVVLQDRWMSVFGYRGVLLSRIGLFSFADTKM